MVNKMATYTARSLYHHHYTIAWVCALPLEMADEIHPDLETSPIDQNTYVLGRIRAHNIVIACHLSGVYGTTSAATVIQMLSTFRYIQFGLMVGIGGDVPGKDADIWLGEGDFGGVVQYDFGKTVAQVVFERTGRLNRPPQILLTAISRLQADQVIEASQIPKFLSEMTATYPRMTAEFTYRGRDQDRLLMPHQTTMGWIMLAIIVK